MIRYSQLSISKPLKGFGVYSIANQCPYSGGNAVYIARNYIAMLGDTIIYDDAYVCLQLGIYRQATNYELPIEVYLKPNPADEYVEIFITNNSGTKCSITINDAFGKLQIITQIDCTQKALRIDTKFLASGFYTVAFVSERLVLNTNKLIIAR